MIQDLTSCIVKEISAFNPKISFNDSSSLYLCLNDFYLSEKEKFVIVIDEWDAPLRENKEDVAGIKIYLEWLKRLLKDKSYVALAYMTGILPIKKYGTFSALNMFDEYSMLEPSMFAQYIGFTDAEVKNLCENYHKDYSQMKMMVIYFMISIFTIQILL